MSEVIFYGLFISTMVLAVGLVWVVQQHRGVLDELFEYKRRAKGALKADELLVEVKKEFEKELEGFLEQAKEEIHQAIGKTVETGGAEMDEAIGHWRDSLETQAVNFQEAFAKRLDEEYKGVNDEIEVYRKERLDRVNQEVEELIKKITKEALGRSITPKDHEELVMKALEKAKVKE